MIEENTFKILFEFCEALLTEGTEITIELIQQNFSKEELIAINDTTYEDIIKNLDPEQINSYFDKISKIKGLIYLVFNNKILSTTSSENVENIENESQEHSKIKKYLFNQFGLEVKEITSDSIVVLNNKELVDKIDEYMLWNSTNNDDIKTAFLKKYSIIPEEKVHVIQSLSEYLQVLSEINEDNHFLLSRGQKDCTFDLVSSLYREGVFFGKERELLNQFTRSASFYDKSIPHKSTESMTAYGQHHGLPTNYLDFTEAHLLSLFFALKEFKYNEKPSIVYLVDTEEYHCDVIGTREKFFDFSNKIEVSFHTDKHRNNDIFIKLEDSNERIHFQKGYFLKTASQLSQGKTASQLSQGNTASQLSQDIKKMLSLYTHCILIPQDMKETIFNELFNIGINYESIYPDIDNLVKNIKHRERMGSV